MDELLLHRAQKGDTAAFEQLITPYEGMLWRVCWHYTLNREDARDCAQESMVKAWRSLPSFRRDCTLESYLYRIAASCCLDFLRKRGRYQTESTDALSASGFDPPDPSPQPEEAVVAADDKRRLREAMSLLPEDMRTALVLSALEGRRYEDIAQITGVAPGTVKSRISRAKMRLAEIFSENTEQIAKNRVQHSERRTKS